MKANIAECAGSAPQQINTVGNADKAGSGWNRQGKEVSSGEIPSKAKETAVQTYLHGSCIDDFIFMVRRRYQLFMLPMHEDHLPSFQHDTDFWSKIAGIISGLMMVQ